MAAPNMANADLLTDLLNQVSRSFYLTLRVLPASIRPQIGLAYLLARATDTIADTEILPLEKRLSALGQLREAILSNSNATSAALDLGELAQKQGLPAERVLLERVNEALVVLHGFEAADQSRVREVLQIITSGQELDLKRFGETAGGRIVALKTAGELDDYTYRVAGCVGEFWTRMCRARAFPQAKLDDAQLLADGVRFGKGLQLVNILRDLPRDLRQGRCYLPAERLAAAGLEPKDLLDTGNEARFRPVYDEHLALARAHLTAGWAYTCALPWSCWRVRLACAWPVLIGLQTLDRLAQGKVLDSANRIKISRAGVYGVMLRTVLLYPFPSLWRGLGPKRAD